MEVLADRRFSLYVEDEKLMLKVFLETELKDFSVMTATDPRISVTAFTELKNALKSPGGEPVAVGAYKDEIEIEITNDKMKALAMLNMTPETYASKKKEVPDLILRALSEKGVNDGIEYGIFDFDIPLLKKIIIAKGVPPVNGIDAKMKYFKLSEKKPEIKSDGQVDYYEINLIDKINKGQWLGEKIPPTEGIEGKNVLGEPIPAKPGRNYNLKYDRNTVEETVKDDGVHVLIAKVDGAVSYKGDKIAVDNHLVIHGDVDYSTGNINFKGFVTVSGTVKDSFSVTATKDITINGPMGIGAVEKIHSMEGSVVVKGGANGKGTAKILAAENVYLKYANEIFVEAGNMINVGLYAFDSTLNAQKIIMSPEKGRIVGGKVTAHHIIVTGSIGNRTEKPTEVSVKGFDRTNIKAELDMVKIQFNEVIVKANKLKRQLEIFELNQDRLDERATNTYKALFTQYEYILDTIQKLNSKVQNLEDVLKTRGDGEVKVYSEIHPKSLLEIKKLQHRVNELMSCSFYVQNNTLHISRA